MMPFRAALGAFLLFLAFPNPARSSPQLIEGLVNMRFQVSPQLFAVMAALEAAGHSGVADTPGVSTVRNILKEHLSAVSPDLRERIIHFIESDKQLPSEPLQHSRYVSLGLVLGPPPEFAMPGAPEDRPPDAERLAGFRDLVAELWVQCKLEGAWATIRPVYITEIEGYRPLIRDMIVAVLKYFRTEARVALDRSILMLPELLQPPGNVNARNLGHTYIVVVGPPKDGMPPIRSIRHEYLHFFIDPLAAKYVAYLPEPDPFLKRAAEQPGALPLYRQDFFLMLKESMVRMIEARLDSPAPDRRIETVLAAYDQGLILAPYFDAALADFEARSEPLPDLFQPMMENLRWSEEEKRPAEVAILRAKSGLAHTEREQSAQERGRVQSMLRDANGRLAARDFTGAAAILDKVVEIEPSNPHALFGLAQAAAQSEDAERALLLYEKAMICAGSEPWIAAWSLVHRGNIFEAMEEIDKARAEWSRVLNTNGDLRGAREAAQKALSRTAP
jgi:tetratricopeptide (TPR) repeat protein